MMQSLVLARMPIADLGIQRVCCLWPTEWHALLCVRCRTCSAGLLLPKTASGGVSYHCNSPLQAVKVNLAAVRPPAHKVV